MLSNIRLLLEYNYKADYVKSGIPVHNGRYVLNINKKNLVLDISYISELINRIGVLNEGNSLALPLLIDLHHIDVKDKLSVILLECLAYYITKDIGLNTKLNFHCKNNPYANEMQISSLNILKGCTSQKDEFIKSFNEDLYKKHFRKVLGNVQIDNKYLSILTTDVYQYLVNNMVDSDFADNVSDVVGELVGNACEHSKSGCLVDIDVSGDLWHRKVEGVFRSINVCVINFSDKLLFTDIKRKITEEDKTEGIRYDILNDTYRIHIKSFDDDYKEDDFFTVAAFQDKISGRLDNSITGGTGLPGLIRTLQEQALVSDCYVISGNKQFVFQQKYLYYDDDGWIGFNKQNDFLNSVPDKSNFKKVDFYMPGTAYNLCFIVKKENNDA